MNLNEGINDSNIDILNNKFEEFNNRLDSYEKDLDLFKERLVTLEKMTQGKPELLEKKISIGEFYLSKNPTDDIQKTLLICYFLEKYEHIELINIKDIEKGFRDIKEKAPKNINYKVFMNIKKGYMMETKEKKDNLKSWILTNTGEVFINNNFKE